MGFFNWKMEHEKADEKWLEELRTFDLPDSNGKHKYSSLDPKYAGVMDTYFAGLEKIQENASMLHNLGITQGRQIDFLINQCLKNIDDFEKCVKMWNEYDEIIPKSIPAYRRLALIYDRAGMYEKEYELCQQAISRGYTDSSMNMKSRLVKCAKKLGRELSQEDVSELMNK